MNYFFSDPHFGHYNVILYSKRPFLYEVGEDNTIWFNQTIVKTMSSTEEAVAEAKKLSLELMEKTMINNWNSKVTNLDTVYVLGDFAFASIDEVKRIVKQLNGKKILILGNHDKSEKIMKECGFDEAYDSLEVKIGNESVILNHYPYLDPELNEIAKLRPNIIKLNNKVDKLPPLPEDFDFEASREFLVKYHKYPINLSLDVDKKVFNYLKRSISTHIGSRLINDGKILLHGHSHIKKKRFANMINLSVEAWNFTPASENEVIELIKEIKSELSLPELTLEKSKLPIYQYYKKLNSNDMKPLLDLIFAFNNIQENQPLVKVPHKYSEAWYNANKLAKRFIPKDELVVGKFYKGRCRNTNWAYWDGKTFIYVRTKFNAIFLEKINCLENDNGFDLFIPHQEYQPSPAENEVFFNLFKDKNETDKK